MVRILLESGANAGATDEDGKPLREIATSRGDLAMFSYIHGFEVEQGIE